MSHVLMLATAHAFHWLAILVCAGFTVFFFNVFLEGWRDRKYIYPLGLTIAVYLAAALALFLFFCTVFIYYFGAHWISILTLYSIL